MLSCLADHHTNAVARLFLFINDRGADERKTSNRQHVKNEAKATTLRLQ